MSLNDPIVKLLLPIAAAIFILIGARIRSRSWRDDLGIVRPVLKPAAFWFALYIVWMLTTDLVMHWRGPWNFTPWLQVPIAMVIVRVLAVAVFGPVAEELIFRGFLYSRLARTRLGAIGAIVSCAAIWAAMHYTYSAGMIAVIFVAGWLLGAARLQSKSVIVPILMHIVWNLYAVW